MTYSEMQNKNGERDVFSVFSNSEANLKVVFYYYV